MPPSRGKSIYS